MDKKSIYRGTITEDAIIEKLDIIDETNDSYELSDGTNVLKFMVDCDHMTEHDIDYIQPVYAFDEVTLKKLMINKIMDITDYYVSQLKNMERVQDIISQDLSFNNGINYMNHTYKNDMLYGCNCTFDKKSNKWIPEEKEERPEPNFYRREDFQEGETFYQWKNRLNYYNKEIFF